MPETYCLTIQTIKTTMKGMGTQILPNDLITIFLQEAEHHAIKTSRAKQAEVAMSTSSGVKKQLKKNGKGKGNRKSHITCDNCQKPYHSKAQCWTPGGDREGQGPNQQKAKKKNELANIVK
jgi:hypothetical protein